MVMLVLSAADEICVEIEAMADQLFYLTHWWYSRTRRPCEISIAKNAVDDMTIGTRANYKQQPPQRKLLTPHES